MKKYYVIDGVTIIGTYDTAENAWRMVGNGNRFEVVEVTKVEKPKPPKPTWFRNSDKTVDEVMFDLIMAREYLEKCCLWSSPSLTSFSGAFYTVYVELGHLQLDAQRYKDALGK